MHAQREARGERPPGGRQGPTATMASVGHEGKKLCLRGERAPGGVPGSGGSGRHSFRGRGGHRRAPSAADAARRPGRGRCPAATTGRETCAFAAEGRRGSCPRAAAAEGTAFGAAEAAAAEDGDALGRPQSIAIVRLLLLFAFVFGWRTSATDQISRVNGEFSK